MSTYHTTLQDAHEALYVAFPFGDMNAASFLVIDEDDNYFVTGRSLLDVIDVLRVHREMNGNDYADYEVYRYTTIPLLADVSYAPKGASRLLYGTLLDPSALELAAEDWFRYQTAPKTAFEYVGDALAYVAELFTLERVTEAFIVEDTESGDAFHVAHDVLDVEAILEREATDGNLSDETVTSGYLIHRISRPENGGPDTWQFAVASPTIRRSIDVNFP